MDSAMDLTAILEGLAKHRQDIDSAIEVIGRISSFASQSPLPITGRKMVIETILPTDPPVPTRGKSASIRPGQFEGMKIWEAAKAFLEQTKGPQRTSQIATCLINGGVSTRAKKLESNLYTLLKNRPEIFRKAGPGLWALQKGSR